MLKNFSKKHWFVLSAAAAAVIAAAAYLWLSSRGFVLGGTDKPQAEISSVSNPADTTVTEDRLAVQPLQVTFTQPAARSDLVGKEVKEGIEIYPNLRGSWRFENDYILSFVPEKDWQPGGEYKVTLNKKILNPGVKFKERSFKFKAPEFTAVEVSGEFYEDPRNLKNKAAVASFNFNYPLDEKGLKEKIRVRTAGGENYDFTYRLSDLNHKLHVMSAPLKIKDDEDFAFISVNGALNAYNGSPLKKKAETKVKIPSSSTFFKLNGVSSEIVRNQEKNNAPEQILTLNFSTAVKSSDLTDYLWVYSAKETCENLKERLAKAGNRPEQLAGLRMLAVQKIDSGEEAAKMHAFKYQLKSRDNCLAVHLRKGLSSVEDFMLSVDELRLLPAADYPLEAKIAFDGAVLPLRNNPGLSFVSRGVKQLEVKLARIDSRDLNHLITQTGGDFAHPYFNNYNFNENNLGEIFRKKLPLNMKNPAEENFSSLDLAPYFAGKKGIFIVSLRGVYDQHHKSQEDRRLVVLTDLGIVVKDNLDKTHTLFVSSISEEKPVDKAKVEVLGKNGLSVITVETNEEGVAQIPDFDSFNEEKTPVVYKVSLGEDVSYLPIGRYDRRLDFSRFETDGTYEDESEADRLNGYAFSDRGIYRPGETAHFGIMLRQKDLQVPHKLPLDVEVINPRGDTAAAGKLWSSADGLLEFRYEIPSLAPVGSYSLNVYQTDSEKRQIYVTATSFKVAEFQPDTLRMKLSWAGEKVKGWMTTNEPEVSVQLDNLYGNPAAGHMIKAGYALLPGNFSFKQYEGFVFKDPLRLQNNQAVRELREELPEVKTDENGAAELKINLAKYAKGTYHLRVDAEGMESGSGRGVSAGLTALVSPNRYLIGYKADGALSNISKGAERSLKIIAVDNNLQALNKDNLKLVLKERKYINTLVEMPNGTYRYQSVAKDETLNEAAFAVKSDGVDYALPTDKPGEFVLELQDAAAQPLMRVDYTVAGASNTAMAIDRDASLVIALNRSEYNSGEEIKAEIKAPYAGYGLITIERDRVYASKWFKTEEKAINTEIRLPEGVEGNAYLNVAWFRSLDSKEIFMPPMSYAAVPFAINKDRRRLAIELETPKTVEPGEILTVNYRSSEPGRIIVWGVNEGILQVAKYKAPNPLAYFLQKKALRVVTMQIMDLIMPDVSIVRFLKGAGGDASLEQSMLARHLNPFARKQSKPVAFWSGIVESSEQGGVYEYKVPETFSGEIKVMAAGVSAERFGSAQAQVLVRGDFALVPSGPYNVSPGDEFVVSLSVANLAENIESSEPVKITAAASGALSIAGKAEEVVQLAANEEKSLNFRVIAGDRLGEAELTFTAAALNDPSRKATMPYYMSVRPASAYVTDLTMGYAKDKLVLKDFVKPMYAEFRKQSVTVSVSPMVLIGGLLEYLDKFPHSCTEQTISKVFPAAEVMFKYPELVKHIDVYGMFDGVTATLTERQKVSGGFASWNFGSAPEDEFDSLYALEFMGKAKEHGFNVPANVFKQAMGYAKTVAAREIKGADDTNPAYAVYVLTQNGEVTTNYLINLEQQLEQAYGKKWRDTLNGALMAASYKMLQNQSKAQNVLGRYPWGENQLNDARYVYVMAQYFPEELGRLQKQTVETLLKPLQQGRFNTIDSAYAVLALNALANSGGDDKGIRFAGKEAEYTPFAQVLVDESDKELTISAAEPFFYVVSQQGFPRGKTVSPLAQGLEITREYLDKDGKTVTAAKLGDELTVRLTLRASGKEAVSDVAVVDLLPGCFDIKADSISADRGLDNSEIREDRMLAYVTAFPESQEITYKVKVVARGEFVTAPVYAEALYDTSARAHTVSGRFSAE